MRQPGATVAPEKAPSRKRASQKKGAPEGRKAAKGNKTKPAPKKEAKDGKKTAKPARSKEATPCSESKGAKILALIGLAKGATRPDGRVAERRSRDTVRPVEAVPRVGEHGLTLAQDRLDDFESEPPRRTCH
jgi:hypothetical protein